MDLSEQCIEQSKKLIRKYRKTPYAKIPECDRGALEYACVTLQRKWGLEKFQKYVKEIDDET